MDVCLPPMLLLHVPVRDVHVLQYGMVHLAICASGRTTLGTQATGEREGHMARVLRLVFLIALLGMIVVPQASAADGSPLWVLHVQNYPGGISNGVRARLTAPSVGTRN